MHHSVHIQTPRGFHCSLPPPWTPQIACILLSLFGLVLPSRAEQPLSLPDALRAAAGDHEEIATAEYDLVAARAAEAAAASALLPGASLTGSRVRTDQEISREFSEGSEVVLQQLEYGRATVGLSTALVDPSGIGELAAAGQARQAARLERDATRNQVLYSVVRAYYEALAAHSAIEVARASAQTAAFLESAAQGRLAAGTETVIGVDRARADRISAEGAVEQATFAARAADLALAHAAGLPLSSFRLEVPVRPALPDGDSGTLTALAAQGRPDLLAARRSTIAARTGMHAAALTLAPDLSLDWDWRYSDNVGLYGNPESWTLSLEARWDLPGPLATAASVTSARMAWHQARVSEQLIERGVELEVATAQLDLQAAEAGLRVAEERGGVVRRNLESGLRLYQQGLASGLEVSTWKAEVDAAAAELLGTKLARDLAEVDLMEVLGVEPLLAFETGGPR